MTVSYAPAQTLPPDTSAHTRWGWINAYAVVAYGVLSIVQLWAMSDGMLAYFRRLALMIATARTEAGGYRPSTAAEMLATMMPMTIALSLIGLLSWALLALSIVAAYCDHQELGRRAYPRRFPWAWSFFGLAAPFGLLVYPIGRAVVVQRQAGAGWAPMWLAIISSAVSLLMTAGWAFWLMFAMFDTMRAGLGTIA